MATWELGTTPPPITTLASGDRRHQHDPLPPPPPPGLYTRRVTLPQPPCNSGPTNSSVLSQRGTQLVGNSLCFPALYLCIQFVFFTS